MTVFEGVRERAMKGEKTVISHRFTPMGIEYKCDRYRYTVTCTNASALERVLVSNYDTSPACGSYKAWVIGQSAYCPSRHIQQGHNAKIGAFRVFDSGQVWARLDFQIIGKMSGWVKVEEIKSC